MSRLCLKRKRKSVLVLDGKKHGETEIQQCHWGKSNFKRGVCVCVCVCVEHLNLSALKHTHKRERIYPWGI